MQPLRQWLSGVSKSALLCALGGVTAGLGAGLHPARALSLYDGTNYGNQLEISLDTTVSYTGMYRVNDPSAQLAGPGNANGNDGDSNQRHGIVGNLFDVVPVLDIRDGSYGAHFSGDFYLNTPYLGTNHNNQPNTLNPFSVGKNTDYTSATRNVNGENARLLDAFGYAGHTFANDQTLSLKIGQQTLLWGESLFFTGNGLAAGQAPIDVITAQDLVNPQAQQVFMPVGQAVVTWGLGHGLTLQGYYQFEWQQDYLQGVGSYFSSTDLLDRGGQRLVAVPGFNGIPNTGYYFFRSHDVTPGNNNGQFGLSLHASEGVWDLGLYGLRYDAKAPEVYTQLNGGVGLPVNTKNGASIGNYWLVYPKDIAIFGTSASTTVGPVQVAGELTGRVNMPLVSGSLMSSENDSSAPLYAVGDTLHAQTSWTYVSPAIPLDPGGITIAGEVEFHHLITVTKNRAALATGRQASAAAFDVSFTPTYFDVMPNLQVTFPTSITYDFLGRSLIDPSVTHGNGQFTTGITGTYKSNWIASLSYVDYLGRPDTTYNGDADRGYVSLNLQHTF